MKTQPRLNYPKVAPAVFQALFAVEKAVRSSGLEASLGELIKLRVSQINQCAFCMNMHHKDARAAGETEQRLNLLSVWHEVDLFSPREKAALRWAETLTRLSQTTVSDEEFAAVREHFAEEELAVLTLAIVAINSWNRFGVGFAMPIDYTF